MNNLVVAMAATRNQYKYIGVTVKSVLVNNPNTERVYIIGEDDDINIGVDDERITYINLDKTDKKVIKKTCPNANTRWTRFSLVKLYLTKLLTDEERVLYLDTDTVVNDDLTELWNEDVPYIGGVLEGRRVAEEKRTYINAGVLLLNLEAIRDEKLDTEILKDINTKQHAFPDQDCINDVMQEHITPIHPRYNWCEYTGWSQDGKPAIYHYAWFPKPWQGRYGGQPAANVWWRYKDLLRNDTVQ